MDTTDTLHLHQHLATIPLAPHQGTPIPMDDQDSEDLEEAKRMRLDLL